MLVLPLLYIQWYLLWFLSYFPFHGSPKCPTHTIVKLSIQYLPLSSVVTDSLGMWKIVLVLFAVLSFSEAKHVHVFQVESSNYYHFLTTFFTTNYDIIIALDLALTCKLLRKLIEIGQLMLNECANPLELLILLCMF